VPRFNLNLRDREVLEALLAAGADEVPADPTAKPARSVTTRKAWVRGAVAKLIHLGLLADAGGRLVRLTPAGVLAEATGRYEASWEVQNGTLAAWPRPPRGGEGGGA